MDGRGRRSAEGEGAPGSVRGEFKAPKSVRGARGVPLAAEIGMALESLRAQSAHAFEGDLVSATHRPASRSTAPMSGSGFSARAAAPASGRSASTISATPLARAWPPRVRCRCEPCRNGWAIETRGRRSSLPTTQPGAHGAVARLRQKDEFRSLGPSRSRRPSRSSSNTRGAAESGRTRFGERPYRPFRG